MTPNSYEELEARLRTAFPADSAREIEAADALADLRKQRDELLSVAQRYQEASLTSDQAEAIQARLGELAALRAGNERLTRERDDLIEHCTLRDAQMEAAESEAERLRKVAEGERERIAVLLREDGAWFASDWVRALPPPALTPDLSSKED